MSPSSWLLGYHSVLGALQSGAPIDLVLVQEGRHSSRNTEITRLAKSRGLPLRFVPLRKLGEIAGGVAHNGFAARSAPVAFKALEDCLFPEDRPSRLLLLDSVSDPHNLGAVIRSAAAFGIDGLIIAGPSTPPLDGAAAKAAAGHLHRVPLIRVKVAGDALARAAKAGYWILGADAQGGSLRDFKTVDRWVLCMGSEARGLRAKTRTRIDEWISIPMAEGVESLNLSVATGILLFGLTGYQP